MAAGTAPATGWCKRVSQTCREPDQIVAVVLALTSPQPAESLCPLIAKGGTDPRSTVTAAQCPGDACADRGRGSHRRLPDRRSARGSREARRAADRPDVHGAGVTLPVARAGPGRVSPRRPRRRDRPRSGPPRRPPQRNPAAPPHRRLRPMRGRRLGWTGFPLRRHRRGRGHAEDIGFRCGIPGVPPREGCASTDGSLLRLDRGGFDVIEVRRVVAFGSSSKMLLMR